MTENLPKELKSGKLGDVCTYSKGKKPALLTKSISESTYLPYINIKAFEKGIFDEYTNGEKCNLCKDGDILMVWDGARCGYTGKAKNGAVGSTLMKIEPKEVIAKEYLYYFLQSKYYELNTNPKGVGIPHIEPTLLWNFELYIPTINQQHLIVSKIEQLFTELDKGIEYLQTAKQQLKIYRQAVLKWAFEGKLTNKNVKEGELPNGWKYEKLGSIFEVFIGSTPSRKKAEYWNGNINWLSSGEVAFNKIRDTKEKITKLGLDESSCRIHPSGTVILAMIGEGKTRGQAAILKTEASHNQNTAAIRVDGGKYLSELLYHYFVFTYDKNRGIGSGNNQKALNKERIKNFDIPIMSIAEQRKIISEIESRLSVCDKIEETIESSLQQAEALRLSILKKAFEGKLIPQESEAIKQKLKKIKNESYNK